VRWTRASPLLEGLPDPAIFYHVHSYVPHPDDETDVLGLSDYGERFASVVARGNVFGAQFHPEKSSAHGLRLLANFAALAARTPA
jgi:glutamine amidotransferase